MKNLNFSQIKIFIKLEIIGEEYKNKKNIYIFKKIGRASCWERVCT